MQGWVGKKKIREREREAGGKGKDMVSGNPSGGNR